MAHPIYYVVKFLNELSMPTNIGKFEYVCVPSSWTKPDDDVDGHLAYTFYPEDEDRKLTNIRVKNNERHQDSWKKYLVFIKDGRDSYDDAVKSIQQLNNDVAKKLSEDLKQSPSKETGIETIKNDPSFRNSASNLGHKIDITKHPSSSRSSASISEQQEYVDETNRDVTKHSSLYEYWKQIESLTDKFESTFDGSARMNIAFSKALNSLKEYIKKLEQECGDTIIQNEQIRQELDPSQLVETEMLGECKPEETGFQPEDGNDLHQILNPLDSRSTLRYPRQDTGLQELISGSKIYVNTENLKKYLEESKKPSVLVIALMCEIFNDEAIENCTLSRIRDRMQLDADAMKVLKKIVRDHADKNKWHLTDASLNRYIREALAYYKLN